jgi:L-aspartate oxidase
VVVVGTGAAGIAVALTAAARGLRVLVVTKDLVGGATPLAQGGLAAALGQGDTPAAHTFDTLVAGAGLCEPDIVAALADGAPGAIEWLTRLGARLNQRDLRLEGGHSARRIVHSGDATGAEVHRTLLAALVASGIEILDRTVALGLRVSDMGESPADSGRPRRASAPRQANKADRVVSSAPAVEAPLVIAAGGTDGAGTGTGTRDTDGAGTGTGARGGSGAAAANAGPVGTPAGEPVPARSVTGLEAGFIGADGRLTPGIVYARAVVMAAGGLGQAFGTTSNPAGATGDGIAIAARAGAVVRDLEFVQFHPTVLWLPGASGQCPLMTEALRGAGAVLRDLDGTPLMARHDPRGDLAPRDVVAARMTEVIAAGDVGHVWLDATGLGRELLENGFPTVTAACRKHGVDPVTEMIPVAPGAHYSCGGIQADLDGRTSLSGLYAAGEAASTGVQGANRLASNSVTEAVIAGRRTGTAVADALTAAPRLTGPQAAAPTAPSVVPGSIPLDLKAPTGQVRATEGANAPAGRDAGPEAGARRLALAQSMSRYAGVMRDADGLMRLLREIAETGDSPGSTEADGLTGSAEGDATFGATALGASMGAVAVDGGPGSLDLEVVEAANLRAVSTLITVGAWRRAESRGCHRRRDAPDTAVVAWHTLMRWDGHRLVVSQEAVSQETVSQEAVSQETVSQETVSEETVEEEL